MSLELFRGYTPIASGNQLFLERPRVNRLLGKAVQKQIVSVTAGAGYGKTHAVRAFVKSAGILPVWIRLSERDNQEGRFWETFTAAFSAVDKNTADKLRVINFPAADRQFEKYLSLYKRDIFPGEKKKSLFLTISI